MAGRAAGLKDYGGARLTRHALGRFAERFGADPDRAEAELRASLSRARRLGRDPSNGALAVLTVYRGALLVAVFQESTCLTVLTWPLFEPRMVEFGRTRLPRKRGRFLRRLIGPGGESDDEAVGGA